MTAIARLVDPAYVRAAAPHAPTIRALAERARSGAPEDETAVAAEVIRVAALAGRSCRDCALCCKLLAIPALGKPERSWCAHCRSTAAAPCGVYPERPHACRVFVCGWLRGFGEDELKPARAKIVIDIDEDFTAQHGVPALRIHVDPAAPDALARKPARRFARAAHAAGFALIVESAARRVIIPPPDIPELELLDPETGAVWASGSHADLP